MGSGFDWNLAQFVSGINRLSWVSTRGRAPRFLTLSPDASALVVANEGTDSVVAHRIQADGDIDDGRVAAQTGSPVCITFIHP